MLDLLTVALPAFLASLVEFVEAFTIVLAVGTSRSWPARQPRSSRWRGY